MARPRRGERRRIRRRAEDQNLRRILNANADGVVVVDQTGSVCFANPAAETLFGRGAGQLLGADFGFPMVAGATTEVDVVGRSGDAAVVEMRASEIEWEGEPAYLASLRDITDRRRAEEERAERGRAEAARAQAEETLRARNAFLAMAAHELKTPLTRLGLAVQRALRRPARGAEEAPSWVLESLRLVEREAAHLSRLVRQLLDAALIEGGTFALNAARTDLRPLAERALAVARRIAEEHDLVVSLPARPLEAMVDPVVVEEVFTDLLASAVRYSPAGTRIEVELVAATVGGARVARLVVRDHGPPVPEDVRAALRAPELPAGPTGYTPGPGVAVHVGRGVAELHGGRLALEFPEDGGTRLVLELPLA